MFLFDMLNNKMKMPGKAAALPGRDTPIETASHHVVSGVSLHEPYPQGMRKAMFGLGCFWGAERKFWEMQGVYLTKVGYAGGLTANPTYKEVCTGMTGHNEVVLVVFDPEKTSYEALLKVFWESHDPTQGMRQGNDVGTQYRSGIYVFDEAQKAAALASRQAYQKALKVAGHHRDITTEIVAAPTFYHAEEYHQQYLARNPQGYCGLGGTGVSCPVGAGVAAQ